MAIAAGPARAQGDWIQRPIRLIVPFAPGGTTDVMARLLAEGLSARLSQPVVVENRAGAGATIGASMVARAAPDGHTLLMSNSTSHGVSPALYPTIAYDPMADFTHVALVATSPSVLVVTPSQPARTLRDFVRQAKREGELRFAVAGLGTSSHLAGVRLGQLVELPVTAVPYRGAGPAMTDVIGGVLPAMMDSLPSAGPHIRSQAVRALAVTSEARSPVFPDVPTMRESGVDLVSAAWFGVSAPRDLPAPIVARLADAIGETLRDPRMIARFEELLGAPPPRSTPDSFRAFVAAELATFGALVRAAGLQQPG
jgi:tripartite-type tricarboxylate transporter receptor subunit TctC